MIGPMPKLDELSLPELVGAGEEGGGEGPLLVTVVVRAPSEAEAEGAAVVGEVGALGEGEDWD